MAPIVVPSDVEEIVRDLVSDGVYPDDESALRDAVRELSARLNQDALWSKLDEGDLNADDMDWTDETKQLIRNEAEQRHSAGEKPHPDVLPD